MAREVEDRTTGLGGLPPVQRPPAPPDAPEKRGAGWVPWVAVAVLVGLLGGLLLFMASGKHHTPNPTNSVAASAPGAGPSANPVPSLPAPVPATTYQAFSALPVGQQNAVMLAAIERYVQVTNQAYLTWDDSLFPLVATGDMLATLEQKMTTIKNTGYGLKEQDQATVLQVLISPALDAVTIQVRSSGTDQYVNHTTMQPIGTTDVSPASTTLFTFVIQNGTWKVSEHLQVNQ